MRLINFLVICALVIAAAAVYKIKFESTLQAERVAKLRNELHNERNMIASLHAEWSALATPGRIQKLAERHLTLKPVQPAQFNDLAELPARPSAIPPAPNSDPIGILLAPNGRQSADDMSSQRGR
jgi:cell division protein FtsL